MSAHRPYWHANLQADFCEACGDEWPCLPWRESRPPKCLCSHVKHERQCWSRACGCRVYRPQQADDKPWPARFDERYDPSPEPIDRSIK